MKALGLLLALLGALALLYGIAGVLGAAEAHADDLSDRARRGGL